MLPKEKESTAYANTFCDRKCNSMAGNGITPQPWVMLLWKACLLGSSERGKLDVKARADRIKKTVIECAEAEFSTGNITAESLLGSPLMFKRLRKSNGLTLAWIVMALTYDSLNKK